MKKMLFALMLCMVLVFTSCSSNNPSTSASSKNNTETTNTGINVNSGWLEIDKNIYNLSSLLDALPSNDIAEIYPEENILLTYDHSKKMFSAYQYDLENMSIDTQNAFIVNESIGGGGQIVKMHSMGNKHLFEKSNWTSDSKTVTVYDYKQKELVNEFVVSSQDIVGFGENDSLLCLGTIETDTLTQTLNAYDITTSSEKVLLKHTLDDRTHKPMFEEIVQGHSGYAFIGNILPSHNQQSIPCYGLLNEDVTVNTIKTHNQIENIFFEGGMVIYDSIPTIGTSKDQLNQFEIYNADTLQSYVVVPKSSEELFSNIVVSRTGKYILTSHQKPGTSVMIYRVYAVNGNNCIAEFNVELPSQNIAIQKCAISENTLSFIIILQDPNDSFLYYFEF